MKYAFAALLVALALVLVFHIEQIIPIPQALGGVLGSALAPRIPFSVKAAYAESCIAGIEAKQTRAQYAVSETAVRLGELDTRIACLRRQLSNSVERLDRLVNQTSESSPAAIGREVQRHDNLQWLMTQAMALRSRLEDAMKALEQAEGDASHRVVELRSRLELVALDHERNNAHDLANDMLATSPSGERTLTSLGTVTIASLERQERVRDDWHRRYGLVALESERPRVDPLVRAKEILHQSR